MKTRLPQALTCMVALAITAGESVTAQDANGERPPAIQHELVTELVTNPVEYRALIKQAMQGHLGALGLILMRRAPDAGDIPFHADALVRLTALHASLFPADSVTAATRGTIWSDSTTFEAASRATAEVATQLRETIDSGTLVQKINGVVELGESCESCHARFRSDAPR